MLMQFTYLDQPKIDLYISELDMVRRLAPKGRLSERLEFYYEGGYRRQWPLHRVFDQDYNFLDLFTQKSIDKTKICNIKKLKFYKRLT